MPSNPVRMLRRLAGLSIFVSIAVTGLAAHASPVQRITHAPLIHLPADQASHPKVANEWWYVVGHLHARARIFGFETTVFRFAHILPPGFTAPIDIFRTDIAVTDEHGKRFYQKVSYSFPQSAVISSSSLNLKVGDAALTGSSPRAMNLSAHLAAGPGGDIALRLSSQRPAMNVGGRGYIPFGNGFTYYYSLTDLATSGTLRLGRTTYRVSGISWLDHQWGNWSWHTIRGWTWMALQLSNGTQLSVFDFRGTTTHIKAASVLLASGRQETIYGTTITSHGTWTSPHTGGMYPSGWTVSIPALRASLRIAPAVRDQELAVTGQKVGSYWEGSGHIRGTFQGKSVTGLSYTELTGYAAGFLSGH